jgi:pimeloyl-ACP methyl ester carboxylesterase
VGGENMLCLHGQWGRGETWVNLINRYRDRYRVIAPDQRGHGLSDRPICRYASEDLARDAHGLLNILKAVPTIVIGHSLGGRVGAYLAALFPEDVRALVMVEASPSGPEKVSSIEPHKLQAFDELTSQWPVPYTTHQEAVEDLEMRFPRATTIAFFLDSLAETEDGYDFQFSRFAMAAINEYMEDWYHILPAIRCPVFLVHAEESRNISSSTVKKMCELIENCVYAKVSGSDHMVYVENPEVFYELLDAFLITIPKIPARKALSN